MKNDPAQAISQFQVQGTFVKVEPYGSGHINDTYAAYYDQNGRQVRYLLQRINHVIFKNPPVLMESISRVTQHIRKKLEQAGSDQIDRRVLTLIPTLDGKDLLQDEQGLFWRTYVFIEDALTYDIIESPRKAYEAAKAFGKFQCQLADLPKPRLPETIPDFHHTRSRFEALIASIKADVCGRAHAVKEEIDFALQRESIVDILLDLQATGKLPQRITHNDTKLNNVMIDHATSEGICAIDLDTVMPGLALYDFGDMVRTATNTGAEDERALSKISMNSEMFEALAKGYLESTEDMLTPLEVELLSFSGKLITFEIGLRFLTDFLSGDDYFKIHREEQNLDRCRTQFKLMKSIEEQEDQMKRFVESL